MMIPEKVFIVGTDRLVEDLFCLDYGCLLTSSPQEADLVVFTGGEDLHPSLYNETPDGNGWYNRQRDAFEVEMYKTVRELRIPMVGICRGGQLINVMEGGRMIQDLWPMHYGKRLIRGEIGSFMVEEDHHQGMIPPDDESSYKILAYDDLDNNVEVIWFPEAMALAFQAHPEWDVQTSDVFKTMIERTIEELEWPSLASVY